MDHFLSEIPYVHFVPKTICFRPSEKQCSDLFRQDFLEKDGGERERNLAPELHPNLSFSRKLLPKPTS